jgi:predicted phosphodiesterase
MSGSSSLSIFFERMRVFAISDLHLEYEENSRWVLALSESDYRDDVLILAGDVSERSELLHRGLQILTTRFRHVLYVPGNHELWVNRRNNTGTSFDKFVEVCALATECGVSIAPFEKGDLSIIPMLAWYDYTFGRPCADLRARWRDFHECRWPEDLTSDNITEYFLRLNVPALRPHRGTVLSFSHFLPRIDVLPKELDASHRMLFPVMGTARLEKQIRELQPSVHVYGHSHLNRHVTLDGIAYVNNAFGYPGEEKIAAKQLRCLFET